MSKHITESHVRDVIRVRIEQPPEITATPIAGTDLVCFAVMVLDAQKTPAMMTPALGTVLKIDMTQADVTATYLGILRLAQSRGWRLPSIAGGDGFQTSVGEPRSGR